MEKIIEFLKVETSITHDENREGNESGNGDGNGSGSGSGNGYGSGNGDGDGDGDGCGSGDGDGCGSGYGNGSGNGYGYGNGDGYGDGYGSGNGDGDGYGNGSGDGLNFFNGSIIYLIDGIQTIVTSVRNNIAKGFVVQSNLSLTECYIVKSNNMFSHGSSIKEALKSLEAKLLKKLPILERVKIFKNTFKDVNKKYSAIDYFNWHCNLTGSCELGRKSFVKDNNIDLKKDCFTVKEFINLTKNKYGSNVILELEKSYE